jgi:cyclohexanone monooxygenase
VEWVTGLIRYMRDNHYKRVEPTAEAEGAWTEHVYEMATRMLFHQVDSWFMGVNPNVPGKQKRTFLLYSGGAPAYRETCDAVASNGYDGFVFD